MTIENNILAAKQAAAEDMYEALIHITLRLVQPAYFTEAERTSRQKELKRVSDEALLKATYVVRPICPNCDTELPEGCRGEFKESDGNKCLWEETKKEPL